MTCSWDFSRAEEKEQQVRAARAARGKARQQKADRHSHRLTHQREKAALALARLTADPSDAEAHDQEHHGDESLPSSSISTEEHNSLAAADEASTGHSEHAEAVHVRIAAPGLDAQDRANAWQLPSSRHNSQQFSRQTEGLTMARSLPVTISHQAPSHSAAADHDLHDKHAESASPVQAASGARRQLASVAGYPSRHVTVPGPLLHSCAVESRRNSPSSMQSWQIVRPRPVKCGRVVNRDCLM